jgi:hypothetical protein
MKSAPVILHDEHGAAAGISERTRGQAVLCIHVAMRRRIGNDIGITIALAENGVRQGEEYFAQGCLVYIAALIKFGEKAVGFVRKIFAVAEVTDDGKNMRHDF